MRKFDVCIMYDSDVINDELKAIFDGMEEVKNFFPGRQFIDGGRADWLIERAFWPNERQIDASSLMRLLMDDPSQSDTPFINLFFTSRDLTVEWGGEYAEYCFGLTSGRFSVQSVAPYRCLANWQKTPALKMLVQHELGHIFGLASSAIRSNTEFLMGNHCTNSGCVMNQALDINKWADNATIARASGMIYCPQCREEARIPLY